MDEDSCDLEMLLQRIHDLERRVYALENPGGAPALAMESPAAPPSTLKLHLGTEDVSGAFAVLGKAMLGIAGAYLLRAVAASDAAPKAFIAALAILYAIAWLVGAARVGTQRRYAAMVYAGTSALILMPMLWELTLRFHLLPPALDALVLALFAATATVFTRTGERATLLHVAYTTAALAAVALSIGTHEMLSFIALLLLMLAVCEYKTLRERCGRLRILVAVLADLTLWMLIFVYRSPLSARMDYPNLSTAALLLPALALLVLQAASVARSTELLRTKIAAFDVLQSMIAFLLALCAAFWLLPASGPALASIAVALGAAGCYAAALLLNKRKGEARNFHVFSTWGGALLLAALFWTLPLDGFSATLAALALAAILLGVRMQSQTFEFHGVVFLSIAAATCGLMNYTLQALAGDMPLQAPWIVLFVAACSLLCYAAGKERVDEGWQQQVLHFIPAWLTVCSVSALLARGLVWLAALAFNPDLHHVAFVRTLTVCLVALALALGGAWRQRLEMTRIAYLALVFAAAKLIFEDLRLGRMEFIAASIFIFALTLISVPRLSRWGHNRQRPSSG